MSPIFHGVEKYKTLCGNPPRQGIEVIAKRFSWGIGKYIMPPRNWLEVLAEGQFLEGMTLSPKAIFLRGDWLFEVLGDFLVDQRVKIA